MLQLSIGISALQTSQRALDVIGNNIANANTPGYHRQVVELASLSPLRLDSFSFGRGVEVQRVRRLVNEQIERFLTRQVSATGRSEAQLSLATQLESRLSNPQASPGAKLESLFNRLEELSSRLNDSPTRRIVVAEAAQVAAEFRSLATDLIRLRDGAEEDVQNVLAEINPLSQKIARLNAQIARQRTQGVEPNDLLDQRTQAIQELSQRIGLETLTGNQDQTTVLAAGIPLVIGERSRTLVMGHDDNGQIVIRAEGLGSELSISGGSLGGLLTARNQTLPAYRDRVDTLAREVARVFNAVQTTGVGISGAFTQLNSQQPVRDVTAPLNATGLPLPPKAGSVVVAVTNTATGERTLTEVAIDPTQHSLTDVANALGNVSHMQAFVNSQTGTLTLLADTGFTFDFRGGLQSPPSFAYTSSTTQPTLAGLPSGAANDRYSFRFLGSGTIGVTPGLQVQVSDQAGATVATLNVGQGYSAGTALHVAEGVTLSLSSGSATDGDSFSTPVVSVPDSAEFLGAVGLNAFFTGFDAATLQVAGDLLSDPNRLATSRNGQPGDSGNLQRFAALRDTPTMLDETLTLSDYFTRIVTDIGVDVQSLTDQQATNQLLFERLQQQQQSLSGVDTNEEMVNLLKFQRMFQIASKYISVVNEAYDALLQIQ